MIAYLHPFPAGEDRAVGLDGGARPASYPVLPVGAVAHCNALIAAGHRLVGLDLPVERMVDPDFRLDAWLARTEAAALVLMDLHWYEHAAGVLDAATRVRAAWPRARIVVGGLTATRFADEVFALCPAIDAVIVGDAEVPLREVAEAVASGAPWPPHGVANLAYRDDAGAVRRTAPTYSTPGAALDALDTVSLGWLAHAAEYRGLMHSRPARIGGELRGQWLMNGRGCAFDCAYCGGGRSAHKELSGLKGLLRRNPEALARDVARLQAEGVHQVALTLDPDMFGKQHREPFFAQLTGRPGFYVESFQLPSTALLDALARHADPEHTEIAITPLSGNERVRRLNGKHYSNAELLSAIDAVAARDLSAFLFYSPNLPGEDDATFGETLALAEQIAARTRPDRVRQIAICHTLDPSSPMLQQPERYGIAEIRLRTLADYVAHGLGERPWQFLEAERGFVVGGRDLAGMVGRWDVLAERHAGAVYAVPRV